ncbi:sensor histidine kinase [Streptomyces smyrnaeus]|uniref:sensor histidine kinase n=1 Tax=Streptomyces smyrnaeus TaxID=1387713 RepID=UPI0033C7437A
MSGSPSSSTPTLREAPAGAGAAGEAALRRRMVRLACTPALVVALAAAGVVTYLWATWEPDDATAVNTDLGDAAALSVLAGALLVTVAALVGGVRGALTQARTAREQHAALRGTAEAAVARAAALERRERAATAAGAGEGDSTQGLQAVDRVAVFVNLARRLQSLLHREIKVLDELENQIEDPEILKGVFQVDHLATRIRRYAENLAVLGGAVSRRQWTRPVPLTEILRSSAAEVEHYQRVKLVPPIEGTIRGQAVADVIHLLSELVENATVYSAPQTQVLLRTSHVTAGLAIEVEDRGLGMTDDEQRRMNALLADPEHVDVAALLTDGRIGLYVVGTLARRHGIAVQLRGNIYGGLQAVLVLPHTMLGGQENQTAPGAAAPADTALDAPAPTSAAAATAASAARPQRGRHAAPAAPPSPPPAPPADRPPGADAGARGRPPVDRDEGTAPASCVGPAARPHPSAPDGEAPAGERADRRGPASAGGPVGRQQEAPEGRPRLPQRRKQEHIAPQLRETQTSGTPGADAVHDPGLMAAFQRGVGRADAEASGRTPYDGDSSPHQEETRS